MKSKPVKKTSWLYRLVKWFVWLFYPKMEVIGLENLPEDEIVIVGNHTQMNGPIACELYFPGNRYTWCTGEMLDRKTVPEYAYKDFWSRKPKYIRPFYKVLSYIIAIPAAYLLSSANTIPVYRDKKIVTTLRKTLQQLESGAKIVIFPETDFERNNIINEFLDGFIDIAKLYYKRTGKELSFVPLYIAPKLKKMYLGKPITFCSYAPLEAERHRICEYLMNEITAMARSLPKHTVIPFKNIPKKYYPTNISDDD